MHFKSGLPVILEPTVYGSISMQKIVRESKICAPGNRETVRATKTPCMQIVLACASRARPPSRSSSLGKTWGPPQIECHNLSPGPGTTCPVVPPLTVYNCRIQGTPVGVVILQPLRRRTWRPCTSILFTHDFCHWYVAIDMLFLLKAKAPMSWCRRYNRSAGRWRQTRG